ncbi:MAG: PDZ domain-containing protein [Planctomycetaceae bacterium]
MIGRAAAWPICSPAAWAVLVVLAAARLAGAADVAALVEQLGADQFARREAAARGLVAMGMPAVEPIEQAVRSGDLEVASRGVDVLRQLLDAGDEAGRGAAERSLARLGAHGPAAVVPLAAAALDFHRRSRSAAARIRLEELGAIVRERPPVDGRGLEVEIGATWRGGPDDMLAIAALQRLAAVSIRGVPLDAAAVEMLGEMRELQQIELFGTGAGREAAELLGRRLPTARIDVRRGGRLGVTSAAVGGPCEVRTVEPGSAADQAGLRGGDVILAVDGVDVANFDDLTARLGDRTPGEAARLVVARRGGSADGEPERIECDVRLDAW